VVWVTCAGKAIPKHPYAEAILLEYVKGGTIKTAIKSDMGTEVTLDQLEKYRFWAANVSEGMRYMHGKGIAHRDLKPDNIMLKPVQRQKRCFACLGDFGFAKQGNYESYETNAGESMFAAPEIPKSRLSQPWRRYTQQCDVFSFGKTLLAMVACTDDPQIILKNNFPSGFPDTAKRLVVQTTESPPAQRGQFRDICNHEFFRKFAFAHGTVPAIDFPRDATA